MNGEMILFSPELKIKVQSLEADNADLSHRARELAKTLDTQKVHCTLLSS